VKSLVFAELSGFILDEFEDRTNLFGGSFEVLCGESVQG
jgi:hypothetical protein